MARSDGRRRRGRRPRRTAAGRPGTSSRPSASAARTIAASPSASAFDGESAQSVGPDPDWPTGRSSSRERARRAGTSAGTRSAAAGARSLATARTPARSRKRGGREPRLQLPGEVAWRTRARRRPPAGRRPRNASKTARRRDRRPPASRARHRARRRGAPGAAVTRSPRPSTSAQPPARKNGQSEPSDAAMAARASGVQEVGDAPCLERPVEGGRRVGRAARQAGGHRDPLLEADGERRERPIVAGGPDRPPGRRDGPQDEVLRLGPEVGRQARSRARPRGGGPRGPKAGPRASRSARSRGAITEWRAWKPSGRRPTTARVRLSLAGATRTTGVTRPARGGHGRAPLRAAAADPPGSGRARREARSTPPPPASGDGDRRRCPASASAAAIVAGSIGSWRGRTLWSILRRSRKPAWTRRQRSSSIAAGRRPRASGARTSRASTADSTSGAGSNASRGTRRTIVGAGVVLDEDRQVAHRARRRRDPLRHLALDHEDAALGARPRLAAEQPVEDRAGDVVRAGWPRRRTAAPRGPPGPRRGRRPRRA